MSVEKDPEGRRRVRVEVEVPGTPEQVWQAIATGPGISAWFVPTQVDGRVGGEVACDFGGGMVSKSQITAWQPPHRFVAEDSAWLQGPPVATEWTVEARGGGTCVVRVVHSLFASTDDWDDQLESTESGWPAFFRVLRFYLEHHLGQPTATIQAMVPSAGSTDELWSELSRALELGTARPGQTVRLQASGAAELVGTVERFDRAPHGLGIHVRLSEPTSGVLLLNALDCNGMKMATLQTYLFGARAPEVARDSKAWQDRLAQAVPPPPQADAAAAGAAAG